MAEEEKDRQLDALLDSLLSDYSAAEPRPGLDLRIRAGLRAHAAHQRRRWLLIFATSAAVAALLVAVTTVRTSKTSVPAKLAGSTTSAGPQAGARTTAPPPAAKRTPRFANVRRARVSPATRNRLVLELANAMPEGNLVFEREKLYLSSEPQRDPEPVSEPQTSAPSIEVKDLGVQTIEIKDLPSVKSMDSKGNL